MTDTLTVGDVDVRDLEDLFNNAQVACEALRHSQCPNPASWTSTCPACGAEWTWCESCHAMIEMVAARMGSKASATHDGKHACGKSFPYRDLIWRQI